jgi:hypothetical protein
VCSAGLADLVPLTDFGVIKTIFYKVVRHATSLESSRGVFHQKHPLSILLARIADTAMDEIATTTPAARHLITSG